uniref:5'-methylthioadenosine phosphorylase n=1 Tax=Colletotrichum fructicola (strain Nara gc5) TaxID=1213859 RepID=L2G9I9_COLFN
MADLPTTFDRKQAPRHAFLPSLELPPANARARATENTMLTSPHTRPRPHRRNRGTGLGKLEGYTPVAALNPTTPWGQPASPIMILEHAGVPIAFLARHGLHHQFAPHEEEIKPMDFVVPDQVIDRTKGIRPFTFFEGGVVGHVGFADPFDKRLAEVVKKCAAHMLLHDKGTIICMEGPQFSTRAESHMYRSWGGSVINMSALPEAKLAREAEMAYQMICMATDYDCWHSFEDVDVAMVMKYMTANGENAKRLVGGVLDELAKQEHSEMVLAKHWEGASQGAVKFMTKPEGRNPEAMKNVEFLFPGFWN